MDGEVLEKRFGGTQLKSDYAGLKKAKAVILQCPYEATACYKKGTVKGPEAVLDASEHLELFDEELKTETYKIGIYTAPPMDIREMKPESMITAVKKQALEVYDSDKFPVAIGGEHSISIGAVNAAAQTFKDVAVLHFDAHHDLRDEYDGTKYSHACAARRFLDSCPVVQVGTRSLSREEQDFINTNPPNLKTVNVYDILDTAVWKETILKSLPDNIYLSIDMDVFDPSVMPAVGTPEPGGMGWYEFMELTRMVSKYKRIVGLDVVELMPMDGFIAPDFFTAKLIYRMLGYAFYGGKR